MENREIRRMISKIPAPKELHFWTGDGETYYCEWNSVRKGYPQGCVDIKCKGGHMTYLFHLTEVETDEYEIKPAFNWKQGTPSLEIVEAYVENCADSIWKTMYYFKHMQDVARTIMRSSK